LPLPGPLRVTAADPDAVGSATLIARDVCDPARLRGVQPAALIVPTGHVAARDAINTPGNIAVCVVLRPWLRTAAFRQPPPSLKAELPEPAWQRLKWSAVDGEDMRLCRPHVA